MEQSTLETVGRLLGRAENLLFVTGAGISADSGLPTYRGVGGLYNQDTEDGVAIEDALSGAMFSARPELTWKYLWQIGKACQGAQPNAAHGVIAELEKQKPNVWVLTQNVDGLHRQAGSQNLVEVHGNIYDLTCTECDRPYRAKELLAQHGQEPPLPPRCAECQGILRPQVVLFGELLSPGVVETLSQVAEEPCDLIFAVGTTAVFPYIREPVIRAAVMGVPTVEINPRPTSLSDRFSYCLRMGAAEAMEQLWDMARE